MDVRALDDLQRPGAGGSDGLGHLGPLIASVGKDAFDEGETAAGLDQDLGRAVTVLNIGGVDGDAQQQAERIDEDMALRALDLLARVIPRRIERGPPFAAPLTLWLSMTATVGLASRPARSRVST